MTCFCQDWGGEVRHLLPALHGADSTQGRQAGKAVPTGDPVHSAEEPLPPLTALQRASSLPQQHLPGSRTTQRSTSLLHIAPHFTTPCCTAQHHIALHSITQHHTASHCTAPHCTAQYHMALHYIGPHSTANYHTVPNSTALYHTALHCTAPHSTANYHATPHCTAQHHTARHCTAQHSTAQIQLVCLCNLS